MIDECADQALAEIYAMADLARVEVDTGLGFSTAFINRSQGQRRRFARQRLSKEIA